MANQLIDIKIVSQLKALQKSSGADLLGKLLGIFEKDFPVQLNSIKEALNAKDFEKIAQVAHKMRSSAGNVGAAVISKSAGEIEEMIVDQELNDEKKISELIAKMESAYAESLNQIKAA